MSKIHNKEEEEEEITKEEAELVTDIFEGQEEDLEEKRHEIVGDEKEIIRLKDLLTRTQADYENFKRRVERDKADMIFFLKSDIFSKILPRLDDLERVVSVTPEDQRNLPLYLGVESIVKNFVKDLEKVSVVPFSSKGESVDPEKHDVMTQVPGNEGVIVDEFMKGYMLEGRVLRHAKVVVGNGNLTNI